MVSTVVAHAGRARAAGTLARHGRSAWRRCVEQWAREHTRCLTEQALPGLDPQGPRDLGLGGSELSLVAAEVAGEVAAMRARVSNPAGSGLPLLSSEGAATWPAADRWRA